ncbi:MAG: hypothetical protein PHY47_20025 [Lachnospiraceae bacterium]|nr:hypothetical protein [Lachnospiraceae bacterium]
MEEKNKWSVGQGGELPIGFGLNLAANEKAMERFSKMSDEEKERIVEESQRQNTREKMEHFVDRLGEF